MKRLSDEIVQFFHRQGFVIVSSTDKNGSLHNSCKGIVEIDKSGRIYLLDLYRTRTYENLKHNHHISITAVNEHRFRGYCLKGQARIIKSAKLRPRTLKAWEKRLTQRITQRIIRNMQGERGHPRHPEAQLPKPAYLIMMEVKELLDLTPHALK